MAFFISNIYEYTKWNMGLFFEYILDMYDEQRDRSKEHNVKNWLFWNEFYVGWNIDAMRCTKTLYRAPYVHM